MGRDQMSEEVNVPVSMLHLSQMIYGNLIIRWKVKFGDNVLMWSNVWSVEGVSVYGQASECHITFVIGSLYRPYNFLNDNY